MRVQDDVVCKVARLIRNVTNGFTKPLVQQIIGEFGHNPFLILISCLLSLRSRDVVTIQVCCDLFMRVKAPQELLTLRVEDLEASIRPIGFFRVKARTLHEVCKKLISCFGGLVPENEDGLLSLPGVGRKTANLVLGLAFGKAAICVDIHVHRISNRLGFVKTKTPEETEKALRVILPKDMWIEWNELLVMWGQNICLSRFPRCSKCNVKSLCKRVVVVNSKTT